MPLDQLISMKVKMKIMEYIEYNDDDLDDKMFLEFQKFLEERGEGEKAGISKKIIDLLP